MSDDKFWLEQQLRQDIDRGTSASQTPAPGQALMASESAQAPAPEDTSDITANLSHMIKQTTDTTSSAKRKRRDTSTDEVLPKKRAVGDRKAVGKGEDAVNTASSAEKPAPAKLGRPTKTQRPRHMTQTYPAIGKGKEDVYDFGGSPEKPASKQHASAEAQTLKSSSRQKGAKAPARRMKVLRSISQANTLGEGHTSAILNGHVNVSNTLERSNRTKRGQEESSGEAAALSPVAGIRDVKRAVGRPPKIQPRVNNDEDGDNAVHEQASVDQEEPPSGQGERQEQSGQDETFHERSSQTHNDDGGIQQSVDLLGQGEEWKKITEAARSVGGKKLAKNRMPKLQTDTIESLIIDIKEARTLYERLAHFAKLEQDQPDGLYEQLQESLDAIEEQIRHDDISEEAAHPKRSEMIRDIYARAIPALVLLVEASFSFHGFHSKGLRRYEALQEIVRLQEMIMLLCMKAKIWKATPNTDNPIKKPTTGIIFPYTRGMKKVFMVELDQQRRSWKIKQNALKTAKSEEERIEQSQRQREESTSERGHRNGKILESIQREREILRSSRNNIGKPAVQSTQENGYHRSNTKWTEEEERELLSQLKVGYKRGQSGM